MTKAVQKAGRATDAVSAPGDVSAFLAKVKATPNPGTGQGRLIFAMDATMSRQHTWDRAVAIQGEMFLEAAKSGELAVQLAYFRGFRESKVSKWVTDARALARLMATVQCHGGYTQIARVLRHVLSETGKTRVNATVFVGDAMEENPDELCELAGQMGLLGTPVFMFQEGDDPKVETVFREIARLTGGAYFKLSDASAAQLAEVLRAVAAYATGGRAALQSQSGQAARLIASQLKK